MTREDLKPVFGAATMVVSRSNAHTGGHHEAALTHQRLGLTLGALACLLLSGCGMSQLERHTTTAGALHAATGLAAQVIDAGTQEAADAATSPEDLAERMEPWRRADAAQHLAAEASDAYLEEVLAMALAAATGEPDDTLALRALSHAVGAYRALADLLATYGVELPGAARVLAAVGGAL